MSISSYYIKIKSLWDELDTYRSSWPCNKMKVHNDKKEEDRLMQFLMGLNDTYKSVQSNILMMSPLPNIQQAYPLYYHGQGWTNQKNYKDKYCEHCSRSDHSIDKYRTLKFHYNFWDK